MIVLIDKDTDARVRADVRHAMRLFLCKFLTDKPFFDQHLPLKCTHLIEYDPIKWLSKFRVKIRKHRIQHLLNLCQLPQIGSPGERKPHQISCKTHTARKDDITVRPLRTEP